MNKFNLKKSIVISLTLILSVFLMVGCTTPSSNENTQAGVEIAKGGILVLRVNPEIAVHYDDLGNVTKVVAENEDAETILKDYKGFEGKECKVVIAELVDKIAEAGFFVEEIEGEKRQVVLEIEPGSKLPNENFLNEVADNVRESIKKLDLGTPINVEGESLYGISDYIDTDYGEGNDGVTDYTDYGTDTTDYGKTDYTDYDTNNQVQIDVTDYGTDYTDYDTTDDNTTDYTDYDDSDYGTPAPAPAPTPAPAPAVSDYTDYDDQTDYDQSDYDQSDYDQSDYDDSDYD